MARSMAMVEPRAVEACDSRAETSALAARPESQDIGPFGPGG
jgi:hypothetical protein